MTNMKKKYQKPVVEILEFENDVFMLTTSDDMNIGDGGDIGEDDDPEANRHRGEWGNLWAED